ncbi:DNA (cytosine-5-)-methyltransferase [Lutimaribacter saemankumensis]|uniref:Cytosine-specific methyltransferase n=1 Tax=Lutimaribacter saemankumensis TaxID=490829 RepID=A0A1G8NLD6_9RHOB|nr:DNA (cytosine-5-)-methyltransferase [Lutimaribacter saemankumensis]SDI81069.1 DNA (cytosine-5)-methyltransferase 1 [Lutimaribacter saemankumensis]
MTKGFAFIDLFAGIGGLRQAMEGIGGRCVFTSEWDKFARQTYEANYKDNRPINGDIQCIDAADVPEHNVLCAGFPCQPFSLAGVSKKNALGRAHGFLDETQGTLFFDVVRILKHHRPEAFLLENVKNLRSHDKGKTFKVIMGSLEELGYTVKSEIIDAQHFLPQHRQRIVLAGFLKDTGFDFVDLELPQKGSSKLSAILHPEDGSEEPEYPFTLGDIGLVNPKYTLSNHLWQYLQDYKEKHAKAGNGFGCSVFGPGDVARTLSARYHKDGSEILIDQGAGKNPRRLTPRECARLMGYSDDFRIPVSDTQAYRQFGNSVAVPVFKEVARIMAPHIAANIDAKETLAG